jgi:hypothetical protein
MSGNDDILQRLRSIDNRLATIERLLVMNKSTTPSNNTVGPITPVLSPTEYVLKLKPSGDVERTLVFANFLEEHRHLSGFTAEDIASLFMEARLKKPANVADKIGKNIRKGLLMSAGEADGKKTWKLTLSGQAYIRELEDAR